MGSVDGIVLCGGTLGNGVSADRFSEFCGRFSSLPVISVGPSIAKIPRVVVDNDRGIRDIILHLVKEHGYKRIACITGPAGNEDADRRRIMFSQTLRECCIPIDESLIYTGDFNDHSGVNAVRHWLDDLKTQPEAIVASNDNMAFGAITALQERGVSVPYSVAVTGFDDVADAATQTPPLSTVSQPIYQQGRKALELLVRKIQGEALEFETQVEPRLVCRDSCGCLSATREREEASLRSVERDILTSLTQENLAAILAESFPRLGLGGAVMCLYDDPERPSASAKAVLAVLGGSVVPTPDASFLPGSIAPDSVRFTASPKSSIILVPLCYREKSLGYIAFEQTAKKGGFYENLASEISTAIQGMLLIRRVVSAEREMVARTREIENLVRPMLDSIGSINDVAAAQKEEIGTKISVLSSSNGELSDSFAQLKTTVQASVEVLATISSRMESLDRSSNEIMNAKV